MSNLFLTLLVLLTLSLAGAEFPGFPEDAFKPGLAINVKNPPYNAKGDGVTDDTKAIQKAVDDVWGGLVYLPPGEYLISDTIQWTHNGTKWPYISLHGAGKGKTVIKLKDSCEKYQDKNKPRPMIETRGQEIQGNSEGSQAFSNSLYHLSINVGKDNPGADGVLWRIANEGTIREVDIVASESSGRAAIDYWGESCGLATNVRIMGFDYALYSSGGAYQNMVLESVSITKQKKAGIQVNQGVFDLNNFYSKNSVPAIICNDWLSRITVQNSRLISSAAQSDISAIELTHKTSNGICYLRNVAVARYSHGITSVHTPDKNIAIENNKQVIESWSSENFQSTSESEKTFTLKPSMHMDYWTSDFSKWANVLDYIEDPDAPDHAAAMQKAIDSGAEIIYMPTSTYAFFRPVIIRGNVRRIVGMRSRIETDGFKNKPAMIVKNLKGPDLTIEMFNAGPGEILLDTSKTVTVQDCFTDIANTSKLKKLYVNNICGHLELKNVEAHIRQLNSEGHNRNGHRLLIDGGTAWILSMKTEGGHKQMTITNGAQVEVFSLVFWHMQKNLDRYTAIENNESSLSVIATTRPDLNVWYKNWVKEIQNGKEKTLGQSFFYRTAK